MIYLVLLLLPFVRVTLSRSCGISFNTTDIADTNDVIGGFGGWGPHLRGLLRNANGDLYFGTNQMDANDKLNKFIMIYKRAKTASSWTQVAKFSHVAGGSINQKDAFLMIGDIIYTYAVNYGAAVIEECYYTLATALSACNYVLLSGTVFKIDANSNYVGAFAASGSSRVVWWTTVGSNGNAGSWTYIANYGGGWNGPFKTVLPFGWTDFAYVAAASTGSIIQFVGQSIVGDYSNCNNVCYRAGVGSIDLSAGASGVAMFELGSPNDALSVGDIFVTSQGNVHVTTISIVTGKVSYFFKRAGDAWSTSSNLVVAISTVPSISRHRFFLDSNSLCLIGQSASVRMYCWSSDEIEKPLTFDDISSCVKDFSFGAKYSPPSGLYPESISYQTTRTPSLQVVLSGSSATANDNLLMQVQFQVDWLKATTLSTSISSSTPITMISTTTSTTSSSSSASITHQSQFDSSTSTDETTTTMTRKITTADAVISFAYFDRRLSIVVFVTAALLH